MKSINKLWLGLKDEDPLSHFSITFPATTLKEFDKLLPCVIIARLKMKTKKEKEENRQKNRKKFKQAFR